MSKSALRKKDIRTFNWLNYHDKKWLNENSPIIENYNRSYPKVDWELRDFEIKRGVKAIAEKIINIEGRPQHISNERVGKELGKLYLLRNHLDKLPKTKEYLDSVIESKEDFKVRRIEWAIGKLKDDGKGISVWRIRQLTGLSKEDGSLIVNFINSEKQKLIFS